MPGHRDQPGWARADMTKTHAYRPPALLALNRSRHELPVIRLTDNMHAVPIQTFACPDTEALFTTGKSARFAKIKKSAERKLAQLDATPSLNFMNAPPGNDLKEYDGAWHVRINGQWRLVFKWGESGPCEVRIADPH